MLQHITEAEQRSGKGQSSSANDLSFRWWETD